MPQQIKATLDFESSCDSKKFTEDSCESDAEFDSPSNVRVNSNDTQFAKFNHDNTPNNFINDLSAEKFTTFECSQYQQGPSFLFACVDAQSLRESFI